MLPMLRQDNYTEWISNWQWGNSRFTMLFIVVSMVISQVSKIPSRISYVAWINCMKCIG